ncbi:unnamed protein product [Ectocarpus sp. 12 AP-2014]
MQDARQTLLVPHCGSVDQRSSQIVSFSCLCNTSVLSQPIEILQPRQGQGRPYDVDLCGRAALRGLKLRQRYEPWRRVLWTSSACGELGCGRRTFSQTPVLS